MLLLENEHLKVQLEALGAELQSIVSKPDGLERMWNGDPAFWPKHSPLLFPVIGTLKNNQYRYKNKYYTLPRHGFAREKLFSTVQEGKNSIQFSLISDEETRLNYPFDFELRVIYSLKQNDLIVRYEVNNTAKEEMYFSVGGHPAFKLPFVEGTAYEDYYLEFNEEETKPRWPISKEGLIESVPVPLLTATDKLPLSKALFAKDALVLKFPTSSIVSLKSDKTDHGLDFNFTGFPYLGLWAFPNADFICIEPWCGIADCIDTDQELTQKEGIETLAPGKQFSRSWTVTFY
jgi:galactose mutarotase-like enzyme